MGRSVLRLISERHEIYPESYILARRQTIDLVAQQKPNLEGCVDVFKAAESYEIKGLAQAAMAAFQERSVKFSEHAELKRLMESGPNAISILK